MNTPAVSQPAGQPAAPAASPAQSGAPPSVARPPTSEVPETQLKGRMLEIPPTVVGLLPPALEKAPPQVCTQDFRLRHWLLPTNASDSQAALFSII